MKIISSFKDYYDYLSGIYGVDPLKVLDRKEYYFEPKYYQSKDSIILFFCGSWYYKGKTIDLLQYRYDKTFFDKRRRYFKLDLITEIDSEHYWGKILNFSDVSKKAFYPESLEIIKNSTKPYFVIENKKDCFPSLKEINFDKMFSADECYLMIESYISKKDIDNIQLDDKTLLEQKGFDKKISFRHRKK